MVNVKKRNKKRNGLKVHCLRKYIFQNGWKILADFTNPSYFIFKDKRNLSVYIIGSPVLVEKQVFPTRFGGGFCTRNIWIVNSTDLLDFKYIF